jgi:excisionase family DNA binding protein
VTAGEQFFESIADAIMERIEQKLAIKKRIFSLDEAAEYLGLTRKALQQKVARGEIRPVEMDRLLRFDILDLDDYIRSSKRRQDAA